MAKSDSADLRLKIEYVSIDSVLPYAQNARLHSPEQVDLIAKSIAEAGFVNPCLIDADHVLVAGHGRVLASKKLGLKKIPVIRLGHLTEQQIQALRIKDNQLALAATWDVKLLTSELKQMKLVGYDIQLLGFPELQLRSFGISLGSDGNADPEATPDPPTKPVSRLGDLWLLGKHRLLCGDATSDSDVVMCLDGAKPHLAVTDPPYGVEYDANWRNERDRANGRPYGASAIGPVVNDHEADWRKAWELFQGDVIYAWSADLRSKQVVESLESCGFAMRAQIVWVKDRLIISRGDYHFMHEPCWYAVRKGKTGHWSGDRKQTTVWNIAHLKSDTGHSTQKPIECMKRPIENNSKVGDAVYEPFCGSGTTIIAAEMTGRHCLAIELSEAYCDVGVLRWQTFSGKEATLEATGQTFAEVKAEREGRGTRRRGPRRAPAQSPSSSPG